MTTQPLAAGPARLACMAAGWTAVALGTLGLFVPGLPATVFMLTAFYCLTRSSPGFARWLRDHPRLGAPLRRYHDDICSVAAAHDRRSAHQRRRMPHA